MSEGTAHHVAMFSRVVEDHKGNSIYLVHTPGTPIVD